MQCDTINLNRKVTLQMTEKFRFNKKKLLTKGKKVAIGDKLRQLLGVKDTAVEENAFIGVLDDAKSSSSTKDKVLTMMKLRSMASTKRKMKGDTKETTHITCPLSDKDEARIKQIPTYYKWKKIDTSAIPQFIKDYKTNVKQADIEEIIDKFKTTLEKVDEFFGLEPKKADRIPSANALFTFMKDHPISADSDIITVVEAPKNSDLGTTLIYALDEAKFGAAIDHIVNKSNQEHLGKDLTQFLNLSKQQQECWDKDVFIPNLPHKYTYKSKDDAADLQEYQDALGDLLCYGKVGGKYPKSS